MIFRTTHSNKKQASQAGVSLMLAVLILSALTAIAFSIAAIVLIELRTSGDVLRTEPALYATLGITEEALMQYKLKFTPSSLGHLNMAASPPYNKCQPASKSVCTLNGVTLDLPGTQPIPFDQSPRTQVIGPGEKITLPMYLPQKFDQQYGELRIKVLTTGSDEEVRVTIIRTDLSNNQTLTVHDMDATSPVYVYNNFQTNYQYDLELYNCGSSSGPCTADDAVTVSIDTYDTDRTTAKGLPFIGQKVFKIVSSYLGLTRSYTVKIPD